jgi:hypothetical protein
MFVSRLGPGISSLEPDRETSTYVEAEADLDPPVIGRKLAAVSVHREKTHARNLGAAIGVNPRTWQVLLYLPEAEFSDVVALADKLQRVSIAAGGAMKRSIGKVCAFDLHAPVSSGRRKARS